MSIQTNRLERWKGLAAAAVLREVAEYVGFALLRFYRGGGMQSAAALTYTTLLALVPLLAIGFAIFSAFPSFEAARIAIEGLIFENLVPELAGPVRTHIDSFMHNASNLGAAGTIGLSITAILLLATIESTFNRIWRVERQRHILIRFMTFWAVLTLGPILAGLTITSTSDVFSLLRETWTDAGLDAESLDIGGGLRDHVIAVVLQSVGFMLLFMVVPNRSVAWRDALIGGALSGAAFEGLKQGFGWYLTAFPTYQTIYGAMAAIPIFLIWVYVSWTVILLGAVFAASFPDWWRSRNLETQQELGSDRILSVALSILAVLRRESKSNGPVREVVLEDVAHAEAISQVLDRLQSAGFVARTQDERFALARDLASATVYDLYRGLGCASVSVDASEGEIAPAIAGLLEELSAAERGALQQAVSQVLDQLEKGANGTTSLTRMPAVAE